MEKLYNKKGQVAVAVSIRFGAGWSTWNNVSPLDKKYNELILNKKFDEAEELARQEGYHDGGLRDCIIEWLDVGTKFIINEYDGNETLKILDNMDFMEA